MPVTGFVTSFVTFRIVPPTNYKYFLKLSENNNLFHALDDGKGTNYKEIRHR